MVSIVRTVQFKRDIKRLQKRGKDFEKLKVLIGLLVEGSELPASYQDHSLAGNWKGYRDAHIEPDWLLIYKRTSTALNLARTGSHSDLF